MTDVSSFIEVGSGIDDEREPEADDEESLEALECHPPANGTDADVELDTSDDGPTLGSLGSYGPASRSQEGWARYTWGDAGYS